MFASALIVMAALAQAPEDTEPDRAGPWPADRAAAGIEVGPGFRASVFAAEPAVRNPIALAWDRRGRLWIGENRTYAERAIRWDPRFRDRVLILNDADRDGRAEPPVTFAEVTGPLTGVEVGRGGVFVMAPPRLEFLPDRNGDDVPDGPAEVILDGFAVPLENHHTLANGLRWGPDGWLWGRCGASSPAEVGPPGTPADRRVPLRGGIWRYHPGMRRFEALTHGTTNPWGLDWDANGEAFFINTVIGHLFHVVAGAHHRRPHTVDPNPFAYELIDQQADHYHWDAAGRWEDSREGKADAQGGGHAHVGLMIYAGDQWPAADRGKLFTLNFHGRRANVDRLERAGCGFVGRHEPDRLRMSDPYFRGIELTYGPDGAVYVLDWSDAGECHEHNGVHRSSGRIYKIDYEPGRHRSPSFDLEKADESELVAWHRHSNEWFARQARIELADRAARGERLDQTRTGLEGVRGDLALRLRAAWTRHAIGGIDSEQLLAWLDDPNEALRAWAIRLATDGCPLDDVMGRRPAGADDVGLSQPWLMRLEQQAKTDPSGLVRLVLASSLQRLPASARPRLAAALLARGEDADDPMQPKMIWYGIMPLADSDPSALADLAIDASMPGVRRLIARRLAEASGSHPEAVDHLLTRAAGTPAAADVLAGLMQGWQGRRRVEAPRAWAGVADRFPAGPARALAALFGEVRALDEIHQLALDEKADVAARRTALQSLIESGDAGDQMRSACLAALKVKGLATTALRGLARFDDPGTGKALAAGYRSFGPDERPALIAALVARPSWARALLEEIAAGRVARGDLSAFQARQIRAHGDESLSARLDEVWGTVRGSDADRQARIAALRARLTPEVLARTDVERGRASFARVCGSCHRRQGVGGDLGPALDGVSSTDLDALLSHVLDPSAEVNADFRMSVVELDDGRVLSGVVRRQTDATLTLQTPEAVEVLERANILRVETSPLSIMPEGLLEPLGEEEVRDLLGFVAGSGH